MTDISRRQFTARLALTGGMALISRGVQAADFKLRQVHNQPPDSPLHKRLVEMWAAVKMETGGRVDVATFADNDQIPGSDPAALKMLVDGELDFFTLNGGLIGTVVPAVNVQGIPFAFRDEAQVYKAIDGDLRQIPCSVRPIRTVDDLNGIKMRSPDTPVYVECWKALGATPVVFNFNKIYEALKTGEADAQDPALNVAELLKLYEVQKYISLTNHIWSGFNLIANLKMWQGLPADVQRIIERNAEKYVKLQRDDTDKMNHDLPPRLTQRGMVINQPDAASFRARLGGYYARWKDTIGSKAWALLESHVGKLA